MTTTLFPSAIEALDHVALTVSDPQRSMLWYQEVFGFQVAAMQGLEQGPPFLLRVAPGSYLNLFPADAKTPFAVPGHDTLAMRHVAFRVTYSRISEVETDLRDRGIEVSAFDYGPRCRSLFVSDPDGHQLELIGYGEVVFTA